ncbi:hypothetical protein DERP_014483 [Dermatophagoides pteronyssinus]|uniref:Pyrroline-5-carboxylate reductase n=1 Tax=Dermatophagoides pteronyssinus TaxID=6956 RepID=A0ABQ8IUH5_DERPT|nr:hypothetical protein DERP_014483 [Dermatophagoides pteronyssinus]
MNDNIETKNLRLIFIGAGNIAQSIVKGLLNCSYLNSKQIFVYAPTERNSQIFRDLGCHFTTNVQNVISFETTESNLHFLLFICVKPNIAKQSEFLSMFNEILLKKSNENFLIVSVMAGITLEWIESNLTIENRSNFRDNLVRIMPNTAIEINMGTIGVYWKSSKSSTTNDLLIKKLSELLNQLGKSIKLDNEEQLHSIIGVAGSGIAFILTMIQGMIDGGVSVGLSRNLSRDLVIQTFIGAAKMIEKTGTNPIQLRENVCSPAGTTIAGVEILEQNALNGTIIQAVKKSAERSKELSK